MVRPRQPFQNLLCVGGDGRVAWTAPLPTASNTDAYVSFHLDKDVVDANSWSGYRVWIDSSSGEIRNKAFAK